MHNTTAHPNGARASTQIQILPTINPARIRAHNVIILEWFDEHERRLPWRAADTTAWGVLVSEIMSQQTPVKRVIPRWLEWMHKWPTPAHLALAPTAEVLLAWDSLGYPRRALRLKECAQVISESYGGEIPQSVTQLKALPGIGHYTAAAVAAFAYGVRTTVLDVNVRRVLARLYVGVEHPKPAVSKAEIVWAEQFVPDINHVRYNAGIMELGALVCTSRSPRCHECPLAATCEWKTQGCPSAPGHKPKTQAWEGTDRQLRGAIMATVRDAHVHSTTQLRIDWFTAPAGHFEVDQTDSLAHSTVEKLERVRSLGTAERIGNLINALIADGLIKTGANKTIVLPH